VHRALIYFVVLFLIINSFSSCTKPSCKLTRSDLISKAKYAKITDTFEYNIFVKIQDPFQPIPQKIIDSQLSLGKKGYKIINSSPSIFENINCSDGIDYESVNSFANCTPL
jgi:hypothetical protein